MIIATISSKGQITLPQKIRKAMDVKTGDRLSLVLENEQVVLRPLSRTSASALAGALRRYGRERAAKDSTRALVKKEAARAAAKEG
jgi:AbrB family looped-hinge helix DNA binding protein